MNQATLNTVVAAAKAKAAGHPEWLKAIEKAAKLMASGELCVTLLHGYALVTSPRGSYKVNGVCECAARTSHCYHRAAKRLVEMMEETAPVAVSRPALIADIKRAWPVACPGVHLADELMRRFKVSYLEALNVDFLVAIKAAIA